MNASLAKSRRTATWGFDIGGLCVILDDHYLLVLQNDEELKMLRTLRMTQREKDSDR